MSASSSMTRIRRLVIGDNRSVARSEEYVEEYPTTALCTRAPAWPLRPSRYDLGRDGFSYCGGPQISFGRHRKLQTEPRTLIRLALDLNDAAVLLYDAVGDR